MSKIGFSKADNRRVIMAFAVVAMFLATMGVSNVEAASPVSFTTDANTFDIMEGGQVTATLTISNQDTNFKKMDLFLKTNWPGGTSWTSRFTDANYDDLENDVVTLTKGGSATVLFTVYCNTNCDNGDVNAVQITGYSDPKWYNGGTSSGSDDGVTDTSPASASSNTTISKTITYTVRTGYAHNIECANEHNGGGIDVYQGNTYSWPYTLTNTGWNTDNYGFTATVTSVSGADVGGWDIEPGLVDPKELTGVDTSLSGSSEADSAIQITPALTAVPGTYEIELVVSSNLGGTPDNCVRSVVVPEPDLEITDKDIDFSHTSAWISTRGDSQLVTIYATVRNNGGNIDANGINTNAVTVKFYVDSAPVGTSQTITLEHGDEETIEVAWNPARSHTVDEVGIVVSVKVDPANDIAELDETNNEGNQFFKVVRTKSSTPSFFMGFFALIGSVAVAVMLSSYYKNKDSEE
ncbi:MAG: hypothetical protein CXT75_03735 [Methanobacteriota archaeon]|jgi:uncharacterized membrane protein|nr:MAG: hypothetical protein CXT75_03735 [Euryarchaeota archaeon]